MNARMLARMGSIRLIAADRAEFDSSVAERELLELAACQHVKVLQCCTPPTDDTWKLLNEGFFAARPEVELRVYGHDSAWDLSFARLMSNVRRFSADCLWRAQGVEALAAMPRLEWLSLGILGLNDFSVLESVPSTLRGLALGATDSKKPSLEPLERFRSLEVLRLEGQAKDIEVVRELRELQEVTLRSITTSDLGYLAPLGKLRSLQVKLGGIRSLVGIEGKATLAYLELWQVRGLSDLGLIGALPGLQSLFVQSLSRVQALPALTRSTLLRRVVLENLAGLHDFSPFEQAPALAEFALVCGKKQTPEQLLPVLRNRTVRGVNGGFGNDRKNRAFSRLREAHGKVEWNSASAFEYR